MSEATASEATAQPLPLVVKVVEGAIAVMIVVQVLQSVVRRGRGVRRRALGWFDDASHREQGELLEAELGALARALTRAAMR
jgi:hypothetical protein